MAENKGNRRERRQAAQAANAQAAEEQDLKAAQAEPKAKTTAKTTAKPKRKTAREQREEARKAAEIQADLDEAVTSKPAPDNYGPGDKIPLHILNQRAREADRQSRDIADVVGREVGKFARDTVRGVRASKPPRSRFAKQYAAEAQMITEAVQNATAENAQK